MQLFVIRDVIFSALQFTVQCLDLMDHIVQFSLSAPISVWSEDHFGEGLADAEGEEKNC